ncbi:hypothetical protein ACWEFJ_11465 [Actinosynnema sp. NPDC004786]
MALDDAIRRAAAEADRVDAAEKARREEADAVAAVAVPRLLALLTEGRDRLRDAGVAPVHVLAPRKPTLFRPARYAPHATVWRVSRVAVALDGRLFELSNTRHTARDRRHAGDLGLSVGDAYAVLGLSRHTKGVSGAAEIAPRDCLALSGGWFVAGRSGSITVRTSYEPDEYTPLEDIIAAQVVTASRRSTRGS